jgi:uncharacterized membrane protein YhaH (DUF805 family)
MADTDNRRGQASPVRISSVIGWIVFLVIAYFLLYAGVSVATFYANATDSSTIGAIRQQLRDIGVAGWEFLSPLLQLAIVLVIVAWAIERFDLRLKLPEIVSDHNIKGVLAILVVTGFLVAVLGSLRYTSDIKDVALVIIGFYFGSNAPKFLGQSDKLDESDHS